MTGYPTSAVGRCSCQWLLVTLPGNRAGNNSLTVNSAHNDGIFIGGGLTGIGSCKIIDTVNLGFHRLGIGSEPICCDAQIVRTVQKEFSVCSKKFLNTAACSEIGVIGFISCSVLRSRGIYGKGACHVGVACDICLGACPGGSVPGICLSVESKRTKGSHLHRDHVRIGSRISNVAACLDRNGSAFVIKSTVREGYGSVLLCLDVYRTKRNSGKADSSVLSGHSGHKL